MDRFCDDCIARNNVIWFKTTNHYLDLNKGEPGQNQFEDFTEKLKKHDLYVNEVDSKTIEIKDIKNKITIIIKRHECGPEILLEFGKELLIVGIATIIIEALKEILQKKTKRQKEKIQYTVYVYNDYTRIELNLFDKESILNAINQNKYRFHNHHKVIT